MATAGVADTHALEEAAVGEPVSCVVNPAQTFSVPVIVGKAFTVTVLVVLTTTPHDGALFDVKVRVTVPVKLGAGVYFTVSGFAVCVVLLNVPPPDVIDHAAVVGPPLKLAPLKVIAKGVAD